MIDPNAYNSADYYDCDDGSEELSHVDPGDAIESYIEALADAGTAAAIVEHAPITVYAFQREKAPDSWYTNAAAQLSDDAIERWCDDFGGEADDSSKKLEDALAAALRAHFTADKVWACERVASREYSADELREMFKDEIASEAAEAAATAKDASEEITP